MNAHPATPPPLRVDALGGPGHGELVVRFCGEVDLLTHHSLRSALDNLVLDDVTSIRMELADLRFCDSQGVRMLNAFVRSRRGSGRSVALERPSPMVRRLLDLFDATMLAPHPATRVAS